MKSETYFTIYQGMYSPRDKAIGWRPWDTAPTLAEAKQKAKPLQYARIEECRNVWFSSDAKRLISDPVMQDSEGLGS